MLSKVKDLINKYLNPSDHVNYRGDLTIDNILYSLNIVKSKYYEALSIASIGEHETHLRLSPIAAL